MGANVTKPLVAVVDDDDSIARALKRLLGSLGVDARSFDSGQAFLDVVLTVPSFAPECVVLDVQMPGLSGLEVQEQLIRAGNRLPVIVITAYDDAESHGRALRLGATAVLLKPFQEDAFITTLRQALYPEASEPAGV